MFVPKINQIICKQTNLPESHRNCLMLRSIIFRVIPSPSEPSDILHLRALATSVKKISDDDSSSSNAFSPLYFTRRDEPLLDGLYKTKIFFLQDWKKWIRNSFFFYKLWHQNSQFVISIYSQIMTSIFTIHDIKIHNSWYQNSQFTTSIFTIHDIKIHKKWHQNSQFMTSIFTIHDINIHSTWPQYSQFMTSTFT